MSKTGCHLRGKVQPGTTFSKSRWAKRVFGCELKSLFRELSNLKTDGLIVWREGLYQARLILEIFSH